MMFTILLHFKFSYFRTFGYFELLLQKYTFRTFVLLDKNTPNIQKYESQKYKSANRNRSSLGLECEIHWNS